MGLMDKVKAQANQLAQQANAGMAKFDQSQHNKRADVILRNLGAAVYAERTGKATAETPGLIDKLIADISAHEAQYGLNLAQASPPQFFPSGTGGAGAAPAAGFPPGGQDAPASGFPGSGQQPVPSGYPQADPGPSGFPQDQPAAPGYPQADPGPSGFPQAQPAAPGYPQADPGPSGFPQAQPAAPGYPQTGQPPSSSPTEPPPHPDADSQTGFPRESDS